MAAQHDAGRKPIRRGRVRQAAFRRGGRHCFFIMYDLPLCLTWSLPPMMYVAG